MSDPTTTLRARVEQAQALAAAATPGPWRSEGDTMTGGMDYRYVMVPLPVGASVASGIIARCQRFGTRAHEAAANADLMAAAPDLVALVTDLWAALDQTQAAALLLDESYRQARIPLTTYTPDTPPPCPLCGTGLTERTEPDGGEEGGTLYAYLCPACRWEDAGSYDYARLTVATAPWTRDLWAEVVLTREERDSFLFQIHALCDARNRLAELVPLGQETGDVESNVAGYIADLLKERDAARCDLAQVEAERDRHAAYVRSLDAALDNTFTDRDTLAARVRELETEAQALRSDAEASRAREAWLMARIAELEAPGECQSVHKLRTALAEVLDHFTVAGHPGQDCLRTGWVPVEQVEQWRSLLSPSWREGQGRNDEED